MSTGATSPASRHAGNCAAVKTGRPAINAAQSRATTLKPRFSEDAQSAGAQAKSA